MGSLFLLCKKDDSAGFPVQAMEGEEFFPAVLFFCEIDQGVFVILPRRAGRKISRFVESYQEIVFKNLVKAAVNLIDGSSGEGNVAKLRSSDTCGIAKISDA